jgi:DNA primase
MGLIPEDVISQIRDRCDIVAVVGRHVQLRKGGRNFKGLCPFHQEKTPSFSVSPERGFFYCFGCQKKGDVFTFVMEYEGKSFLEAAEQLAAEAGVTIPAREESDAARRARSRRQQLLEVNEAAAEFFRRCLRDERLGQAARAYLAERGIGDAVSEQFRLGYAPDDWRALGDHLHRKGLSMELALELGLVARQPRAGGFYDRFRHRLVCPIILTGGEVAGFSARRLDDAPENAEKAGAKYINSPESPIYKKSRLLFGIHRARDAFRRSGRAVLVEGNFDVISLHQAGFEETVAPLGTALTEEQVDQLRRLADEVVLVYDGDQAGRAATLKAVEALVTADVGARITSLPAGEDPDSLVKREPDHFRRLIDSAQPWLEYFIYEVWSADAQTSDGWSRALAEAGRIVHKVADATKRDLITNTLAAKTGLDLGFVRRALGRGQGDDRSEAAARPVPTVPHRKTKPPPEFEVHLLTLITDHPSLVEVTQKLDVGSLLTDERLRDMYSAALRGQAPITAAPDDLPSHIAKKLLSGEYASVPDPAHTLLGIVTQLRQSLPRDQRLASLQRQAEEAGRRGDAALQRQLVLEIYETRKQVD